MLVTLNHVLSMAEKGNYAVGAFNTPNLESIMAVIEAAEHINTPVIISHAQLHESIMPLNIIGPIMLLMADQAKIPVCVHLDHGESIDYIKKALDLGFTSVMYDGSTLPYEENVRNSREVVKLAKQTGASVEAEIGILARSEAGTNDSMVEREDVYTDPLLAEKFVKDTGIDALAAIFGTAHGFYTIKPKLDFPRITKIREIINIPLVMHGGSGISSEDFKIAISKGIRKINYYSYMSREGVYATELLLKNRKIEFFHDIAFAAKSAMKEDVIKALEIFKRTR